MQTHFKPSMYGFPEKKLRCDQLIKPFNYIAQGYLPNTDLAGLNDPDV